jgi:hypothetical protein
MLEGFDPNTIQDVEGARQAIVQLLNLVEALALDNRALREENQRLRDEINRLKGEQGKPQIKPNRPASLPTATNHSSERERHKRRAWKKGGKVERIVVNREQVLTVDPAHLPADAEFKGYDDALVQDIQIKTDNVLFHKEKFYSKRERKAYLAELPRGYAGQFGPPDCLDGMSGRGCSGSACQFSPTGSMLGNESLCCLDWVSVQAIEILAWFFCLGQPATLDMVIRMGNLLNLLQQLRLALGIPEDLGLPKVSQGPCGFAPADPTLMATQLFEEGLQLQIVRGQADDIVARQQVRAAGVPEAVPSMIQSGLGGLSLQVRSELVQHLFHLAPDLVARNPTFQRVGV